VPGSIYKKNQVADCTETKKVHQKGSKVGKTNSCDLDGDWDVVNNRSCLSVVLSGMLLNFK